MNSDPTTHSPSPTEVRNKRLPRRLSIAGLIVLIIFLAMAACTTHSPPVVRLPIMPPPAILPSVKLPPAEPPTMAPKMSVPKEPTDETETVRFTVVPRQARDATRTSVQSIELPRGSSIVINIPVDAEGEAADGSDIFRTRNYHNTAEDFLSTNLIHEGLRVKDRVKFEAMLRDLRDIGDEFRRRAELRAYSDPAVEVSMLDIAERLNRGELSRTEYAAEAFMLRSRLGWGLQVGDKRSDDELIDTAELIRAANISGNPAEYILQVNHLRVRNIKTSTRLLSNPKVRAFADRYEAVKEKYTDASSSDLACDAVQMTMRAKLIEVASGNVIWIGSHTVTELDNRQIELEIRYRRSVDNYESILDFVDSNNSREERVRRYDQDVVLPPFTYSTTVTDPRNLSATKCEASRRSQIDLRATHLELASRVVAELIGTIRISSE